MQVTETLSDGLKRGWTVVVPAADIEDKRQRRFTELGRTVRLAGFRPGKVPLSVVKSRYGGAVMAEVLDESINEATKQVLTDRGLRAATQPKVDVVSLAEAKDLEFKVELELLPEIPIPDLKTLALTRPKATPTDEAIDRTLQTLANRQRTFEDLEPRAAAAGEVLSVDFVGTIDGTAFAGGTANDVDVEIGGGGFIPGFTEQLEGMAPGETRQIEVTFPAEYSAQELAGKAASFAVTAKKLRKPVVPSLDDGFASTLGFDTIAEVRTLLTTQLQREYDQVSRLRIKRQLLDGLAAAAEFPVPEGLVQAEFDQIWARIEADRKEGRLDEEDKAKDEDTLKTEYRAIASRRVKLGLLLAEIGRVNGITVTADEMTRAMRAEAGRYPGREQQVLEFFRKNPQNAESLRGPIFEEKVVDFVLELAQVTEQTVTVEELNRDPGEAPAAS
jgi:trigger factor